MGIVSGVVEATSDKFGKVGVLVEGKWYNSKPEWVKQVPSKGDTIEFEDGGKNYLNKLKIISGTGGSSGSSGASGSRGNGGSGGGNRNLGIELGHAANLAMQLTLREGFSEESFIKNTQMMYQIMASLRTHYERGGAAQSALAEAIEAKEPKPQADNLEDDLF